MQKIIRLPAVLAMTGLSASSIYRLERRGDFPARVRLGPNAVGWLAADVEAWCSTRVAIALGGAR